jgi:hypothetical protein
MIRMEESDGTGESIIFQVAASGVDLFAFETDFHIV